MTQTLDRTRPLAIHPHQLGAHYVAALRRCGLESEFDEHFNTVVLLGRPAQVHLDVFVRRPGLLRVWLPIDVTAAGWSRPQVADAVRSLNADLVGLRWVISPSGSLITIASEQIIESAHEIPEAEAIGPVIARLAATLAVAGVRVLSAGRSAHAASDHRRFHNPGRSATMQCSPTHRRHWSSAGPGLTVGHCPTWTLLMTPPANGNARADASGTDR